MRIFHYKSSSHLWNGALCSEKCEKLVNFKVANLELEIFHFWNLLMLCVSTFVLVVSSNAEKINEVCWKGEGRNDCKQDLAKGLANKLLF